MKRIDRAKSPGELEDRLEPVAGQQPWRHFQRAFPVGPIFRLARESADSSP
jgi:hypothetical protein